MCLKKWESRKHLDFYERERKKKGSPKKKNIRRFTAAFYLSWNVSEPKKNNYGCKNKLKFNFLKKEGYLAQKVT